MVYSHSILPCPPPPLRKCRRSQENDGTTGRTWTGPFLRATSGPSTILYHPHTTTSRYIPDRNTCSQKNDGMTGSLDNAALAQSQGRGGSGPIVTKQITTNAHESSITADIYKPGQN